MATRSQLENALINADKAGDADAVRQFASAITSGQYDQGEEQPTEQPVTEQSAIGQPVASEQPADQAPPFQDATQSSQMIPGQMLEKAPEPGFFEGQIDRPVGQISKVIKEGILGPAETAGSIIGNVAVEGLAGLAGLGTLAFDDAEQADSNIKSVRDALHLIPPTKEGQAILKQVANVLKPVGESIKLARESLGDATMDATDSELLASLAQTVPDALLMATGVRLPKAKAPKPPVKKIEPTISEVKPKSYEQLSKDLKNKKDKKVAEQVMPDADIIKAADDLGVVLNPSAYSNNRVYRQTEQALKDRPGSKLAAVEEQAIIDLGINADKLIKDIGGATDKSMLDFSVRDQITSNIKKLEDSASKAYDSVSQAIPKTTLVKATNSKAYLNEVLKDLGGDTARLTPAEKSLSSLLDSKRPPTYAALDRLRKDVGSGFKGKGVFKDVNEGTLKRVYGALTKDQEGVASVFGAGETYQTAKNLVKTRKGLEKSAQGLLGKELQNSIIPKITQASTALTKGDISKFKVLMESMPKSRRREVAATMLNDLFTHGARNKSALGQGFVNAYKGLNRNKAAKDTLFRELPTEARIRFDKIGKVTEGLYRAKALENKSRTAASVIAALDDGGLISKVYEGSRVIPGVGLVRNAVDLVIRKADKPTKIADDLLTSPAFRQTIEKASKGQRDKAQKLISSSPVYKKWLGTLSKKDAARVASIGFIEWLTENTTNQNQKVK